MNASRRRETAPDAPMTSQEVREYLHIGANALTRYLAQGLPHARLGNRIRVRRSDLDA